ncbi:MAG: VanZ family protein [Rubrivivax sp.]|nr:VanZ family protein [Rubrivivax sp.]
MATHRSSATWLALVYAALVVYASLYPFDGWRWPPGQSALVLAALPSALHQSHFDRWSNLLGYLPLGALIAVAALRNGWRPARALLLAWLLAAALSYACELLQHGMPGRVPAREDWLMNSTGALGGCALALAVHTLGLVDRWQRFRARWFAGDAALALTLLVLWPVALLFPSPVPLGLGQVGERLREWFMAVLEDVPWAAPAYELLATPGPPSLALSPLTETVTIALGLMAPCLVAFSVVAPGWRRAAMVGGAVLMALAGMTLSTLLNFGPEHALSWLGPRAVPGLVLGSVLSVMCLPLSRRLVAGVGLVVLSGWLFGVAQAPDDPYFAQSLQAWEQGRFVRFHGIAQWIGWLWPYAAMVWMLSRLAASAAGSAGEHANL